MAFCGSGKSVDKASQLKNENIEKELKRDKKINETSLRILLLGTGDSGKSTFSKQLTIINSGGFNSPTMQLWVLTLRENTIACAKSIIMNLKNWGISIEELTDTFDHVMKADLRSLSPETAKHLTKMIANPTFAEILNSRGEKMFLEGGVEGAKYFLAHAEDFAKEDFKPTDAEILKARRKTTGIVETTFTVDKTRVTVIDVGGQRSERRKWMPCFTNNLTAVIFLAAINEYDMILEEDGKTNKFAESVKLFRDVSNIENIKALPIILFLNKSDLFEKKVNKVPLKSVFEDFEEFVKKENLGNKTPYEQGLIFFERQYTNPVHILGGQGRSISSHVTCALDTTAVKKIWESVSNHLLSTLLQSVDVL